MKVGKRHARKLLIASLGVAAVSYVQCGGDTGTDTGVKKDAGADKQINNDVVANLVAPEDHVSPNDVVANLVAPDVSFNDVVANLVAPDAGDDGTSVFDVVANLVAPFDGSAD